MDYLEAVRILRRAQLIEFTGWTPTELDAQPRSEVNELQTYLRIKAGIMAEKRSMGS